MVIDKNYTEMQGQRNMKFCTDGGFYSFLTPALDGGKWFTSRTGTLLATKEPHYQMHNRLGGAQSTPERFRRRQNTSHYRNSNP